ncbi:hypothetical protein [Sulfolobus spindle-shaped virus]|nr:hypothetical protein [Sulfolobus spindle-shaped virus]AZG03612.1 hypothetical protein [Sulfolobus spindle-shaped virus]AZG03645.1 hypothetical protein [Sulfolobus spindle-shaped virus]AZG03680.1 hypothetical protein [Sulfolobus spindle-shaped virus]AZG03716.1 hypothetical protein [Sulfolobus spindle-shaped virus]
MLMNRLKVLWFIFILGNIYDVVISAIAWRYGAMEINQTLIDLGLWYGNTSFFSVMEAFVGVKLILIVGVYWLLKLFEKLGVSKYEWLGLAPFAIETIFVLIYDTYNFVMHLF